MSKRPNEIIASFGFRIRYRIGAHARKNSDGDPIDCLHFRVVSPNKEEVVATGCLTADDIMAYCLREGG